MAEIQTSTWAETADDNNAATPDGWPNGQSYASVNNCAREMMAALKRDWNRSHFTQTTTGSTTTATAYTLTYGEAPASLTAGMTFEAKFHAQNGGAATLDVGVGGAKNIRLMDGSIGLPAGVLPTNSLARLVYDGTQFVVTSISDYAPAWLLVAASDITSNTAAVDFTLPSRFKRFRVEWEAARPAADDALFGRISVDGGSSYLSAAASYAFAVVEEFGATFSEDSSANTVIPLTSDVGQFIDSALRGCTGWLEFCPTASRHQGLWGLSYHNDTGPTICWRSGSFLTGNATTMTNFRLAFHTQQIASGIFRLLGRV